MLYWAVIFLIVGLIASALGFSTLAGASFAIAKVLAVVFLVLFVIFLIMGLGSRRRIT